MLSTDLKVRINFLLVTAGTAGSLVFSEILGFPPCLLCWYQRICLYPLVAIFGAAIWTDDKGYRKYALPLTVAGLVISIYHNLLYFGFISEALVPCTKDVSCTSKQLEVFGFLTIPLMSLLCFGLVLALLLVRRKNEK